MRVGRVLGRRAQGSRDDEQRDGPTNRCRPRGRHRLCRPGTGPDPRPAPARPPHGRPRLGLDGSPPQAAGPGPNLGRRSPSLRPGAHRPLGEGRLPGAARGERRRDGARAAGPRHPRHRPVGRLPPARRRGPRQALPEDGDPAGRHRLRPGRAGSRRPRLGAAHLVPGLLPDRRAHRTGAARSRRAARRRRHRRRQVGRLGRRQGADRADALLREPRQRRRLRACSRTATRPRSSRRWAAGR